MRGRHHSMLAFALLCGTLPDSDCFAQSNGKAKPDNPEAQYELAQKYETETGVEHNWATALDLYESAARQGHSQSMFRLGVLYYNGDVFGDTMKADNGLAWLWLSFAAAHGQSEAKSEADRITPELSPSILRDLRMHAAKTLVNGNEVPPKVEIGVDLYRIGAKEGSPKAAEILGALYLGGTLVPRDIVLGRTWYETAAKEGSVKAAEILGNLYMEGTFIARDPALARTWYEKAAGEGSVLAIPQLAKIAESDSPPNLAKAIELYRKAALSGDLRSVYRVGEMYAGGLGVARNLVLAHVWFTAAGYYNLAEGTAAARKLEAEMTSAQLEEARTQVHDLIATVEPSNQRAPD